MKGKRGERAMAKRAWMILMGIAALTAACWDESDKAAKAPAAKPGGAAVTAADLPTPTDPLLARGKEVWAATCQPCHGTGLGGAPLIGNKTQWAPRIAQGLDTLYGHALKGFTGLQGEMPARGGNDKLSDDAVKAAVSFMVLQSR
jgi:cytochrome c5